MQPRQNIRLTLEYDGTRYAGWQFQPNAPTVQGELLLALDKLIGERPTLQVAGRTDAGVHAYGQVVNFKTDSVLPARRFAPGLNHYLPNDISVHRAEAMPEAFDARIDSLSKRYRYRVYNGPQPAALELHKAWQIRRPLDVAAMRHAAEHLVGHHDFEAFRSSHCDAEHARRRMYAIDIDESPRPPYGGYIDIVFWANAFCRHMCRILSGTLVYAGWGKFTPQEVRDALHSRDRAKAGVTAPPGGLTLLEVLYP